VRLTPLAAVLCLLGGCNAAQAQIRPQPGLADPRLQSITYNPDQIVQLEAAPGYQLSVEFAPDEHIESVAVGESSAWQVTPNKKGDHLFLKVVEPGVATNMTVVTDVRTYLFDLVPLYAPSADMAYVVRFNYPRPTEPAGEPKKAATAIEGQYRLSGARAIRPKAISDDGVRTYIEWPEDAPLPAVYAQDGEGQETLTNGMMRNGLYVIDSVSPRLVFRFDKQAARATRILPKQQKGNP
jgi:type IV secretion system protein VirB9